MGLFEEGRDRWYSLSQFDDSWALVAISFIELMPVGIRTLPCQVFQKAVGSDGRFGYFNLELYSMTGSVDDSQSIASCGRIAPESRCGLIPSGMLGMACSWLELQKKLQINARSIFYCGCGNLVRWVERP